MALLEFHGLTLAVVAPDGEESMSRGRGVAPLLELLDGDRDWSGSAAADKVVGAGAAWLYVALDVAAVWADVMSEGAREVLEAHGITAEAGKVVESIMNRTGDGPCPVEAAVAEARDVDGAVATIRATLARLGQGRGAGKTMASP